MMLFFALTVVLLSVHNRDKLSNHILHEFQRQNNLHLNTNKTKIVLFRFNHFFLLFKLNLTMNTRNNSVFHSENTLN
jgi:hypothetical protein